MKRKSLILLFFLSAAVSAQYSYYSKGCLADCFNTGHDCNYCAYECEKTRSAYPVPNYDGDTTCPFFGYDHYNDN
jgi:hypothetical protein